MKKMLVFALLLSSSAVYANEITCPSIESIRNSNITVVHKDDTTGKYIVRIDGEFDTQLYWNFMLTDVSINDKNDVAKQVKETLANYHLTSGPDKFNMCGFISIRCQYQDQSGNVAFART